MNDNPGYLAGLRSLVRRRNLKVCEVEAIKKDIRDAYYFSRRDASAIRNNWYGSWKDRI